MSSSSLFVDLPSLPLSGGSATVPRPGQSIQRLPSPPSVSQSIPQPFGGFAPSGIITPVSSIPRPQGSTIALPPIPQPSAIPRPQSSAIPRPSLPPPPSQYSIPVSPSTIPPPQPVSQFPTVPPIISSSSYVPLPRPPVSPPLPSQYSAVPPLPSQYSAVPPLPSQYSGRPPISPPPPPSYAPNIYTPGRVVPASIRPPMSGIPIGPPTAVLPPHTVSQFPVKRTYGQTIVPVSPMVSG